MLEPQNDSRPFDAADARGYAHGYVSTIQQFDLLERGEEQELAQRWQEHKVRRATDVLVTSHLRLAAKVARRYQGYGLPLADLVAEANLGLVIAASRFEPDQGSRFSTYALWWIKAAHPRLHPALPVTRQDRHDVRTAKAVLWAQARDEEVRRRYSLAHAGDG
jgi:DNA-directed RNA polymerase sigma subunit (sigma70/sigma32)